MNNHKKYLVDVVRTMLANEDSTIESVAEEIGDLSKLKMLLAFTYAHYDYGDKQKLEDRHWQSLIMLFENVRNYIEKTDKLPFNFHSYDEKEIEILEKIPMSFFRGERCNDLYKLNSWIKHIKIALNDKDKNDPRVVFKLNEGGELELAVLAQDYPGSLWRITGTCFEHEVDIAQASGYVIDEPYNLSMDFLKIKLPPIIRVRKILESKYGVDGKLNPDEINKIFIERLDRQIRDIVGGASDICCNPREIISDISARYNMDCFGGGRYRVGLRFSVDKPGILYSFTRILSDVGEITGFKTYSHSNGEITDSFSMQSDKCEDDLRDKLDEYFLRK